MRFEQIDSAAAPCSEEQKNLDLARNDSSSDFAYSEHLAGSIQNFATEKPSSGKDYPHFESLASGFEQASKLLLHFPAAWQRVVIQKK